MHVVVPLTPGAEWPAVKDFADRFARAMAGAEPERFVATMAKAKRKGRIFIDWLRNGRGATSIASFSARARAGAASRRMAEERYDERIVLDRYAADLRAIRRR